MPSVKRSTEIKKNEKPDNIKKEKNEPRKKSERGKQWTYY